MMTNDDYVVVTFAQQRGFTERKVVKVFGPYNLFQAKHKRYELLQEYPDLLHVGVSRVTDPKLPDVQGRKVTPR